MRTVLNERTNRQRHRGVNTLPTPLTGATMTKFYINKKNQHNYNKVFSSNKKIKLNNKDKIIDIVNVKKFLKEIDI